MTLFEALLLMILCFGFASFAKEERFERFFEIQGVGFCISVLFIASANLFDYFK